MTSLPFYEAVFHVHVRHGQRSKGRSAVAKAAYDSGTAIADLRQGRTFDYSRKHGVVGSLILAPEGAASWVTDRSALWNRAEAAEARCDAVTFREVEVGLPREMDYSSWEVFVADACAPYLAVGAICDVSFHCPLAADGGPQPHLHVLMPTRHLDSTTETGFSERKNAPLAAFFESGGRNGGKRGAALRRERERWANLLNRELRAAGSLRRTSSQSHRARGLVGRVPEPKLGEKRAAAFRRGRNSGQPTSDRRIVAIIKQRQARRAESELTLVQMEIEKMSNQDGFKDQSRDIKTSLLKERVPDIALAECPADQIHMIDTSRKEVLRVMMRDGSWLEYRNGRIVFWGGPGDTSEAFQLARAIAAADAVDDVTFLPKSARASARTATRGNRSLSEAEAQSLVDRWRGRGFNDVTADQSGVWIAIGPNARLQDTGDAVYIHGHATDDALRALASKARAEWEGRLELFGSETFKQKAWLEMVRQGIEVVGYDPPESTRRAWEKEQSTKDEIAGARASIRGEAKDAHDLKKAANGNIQAIKALDADLTAFLFGYASSDAAALRRLINAEVSNVIPELMRFRFYGQAQRDPEMAAKALRDWVVLSPGSVTPPCPAIAHLGRHYALQGMPSDEIVARLAKALHIVDGDGNLRGTEELAEEIEQRVADAIKNGEAPHGPHSSTSHI